MAEIYRPTNGIYRCINNPDDKREYTLSRAEGFLPILTPVKALCRWQPLDEFRRIDTAGDKLCMK